MKCYKCNGYHSLMEGCPEDRADSIFGHPIKIDPPINPLRFDLPAPPPPLPIPDNSFNMIGYQDFGSSQIRPINNMINGGMPLRIEGSFVRDTMNNLVGQIGPGNTMFPPPSFGPPKPGGF